MTDADLDRLGEVYKDGSDEDVEKVYREYWQEIVEKDGVIDVDQVKKELFDFHQVMGTFATVYCEITGNRLSKLLYDPQVYVNEFYEAVERDRE